MAVQPRGGDGGTSPTINVVDQNGDGTVERGEQIVVDASASSLPGGCVDGVPQFRFEKDLVVVQDWTTSNTYQDAPLVDAQYRVLVRCSADIACVSSTGVTSLVKVYTATAPTSIYG